MKISLLFLFMLLATWSGAAAKDAVKTKYSLTNKGKATAAMGLESSLFELLVEKKEYTHGWGLFSYSGWSNDGHHIWLGNQTNGLLFKAKPNTNNFEFTKKIKSTEWQNTRKNLKKFSELKNFDSGSFDGLQYEFMEVIKKGAKKIQVKARVHMNNPQIPKKKTTHQTLIETLRANP